MFSLYVIATPIGNLEDITLRALRILKEVDMVMCEDTRVTSRLLSKYDIKTKTISYPADASKSGSSDKKFSKIDAIAELIEKGKTLALVSDAGTPTLSDPGSVLVARLREHFGEKLKVIPIPGPSAVAAALSVSGLPSSDFLFLGFLPHKKGRETLFGEIADSERTVVLYESPHRIIKTLTSLKAHLETENQEGVERKVVIARELTKIFEEVVSGSPSEVLSFFETNPDKIRGEFVVMVGGK